jgi:hypothetical protein
MSLEACEQRVPVFCPPYCFQSACVEYEQAALEALTNTVRSLIQQDVPIRTSEHVAHPARAYDIIRWIPRIETAGRPEKTTLRCIALSRTSIGIKTRLRRVLTVSSGRIHHLPILVQHLPHVRARCLLHQVHQASPWCPTICSQREQVPLLLSSRLLTIS